MANNELVLLDKVLEELQAQRSAPLPDDEAFELFACEQVLRDLDISPEEVSRGVVGGSNDGGIDGIYVFLGEQLLAEDSAIFDEDFTPSKVPSGSRLLLWLVQAKREEGFSETTIDKVSSSSERLLDLSKSEVELLELYSESVVDRARLFRSALQKLATRHPLTEIRFSYVTRGATVGIDPKVKTKAGDLEAEFSSVMTEGSGLVEFLGAAELWHRSSSVPSYTLELNYQETATSGASHVAIVSLKDYLAFLTDETGSLRRYIFDWNVRDYEGTVEVNREIEGSLGEDEGPEFWWLNNGVTIICSKASIVSKTYILDDVQIVNGLQTSQTIYHALHEVSEDHPALQRSVLVRILATNDVATRDRVIRATNRQTSVPAASLRATDEVQRSIEAFFLSADWFYDRRKNYYRNMGRNPDRIVGIPLLAQAVMAMGLSEPDNSRARPSSLLKRDEDYDKIFSPKVDLRVYLWAAKSQRAVDLFLLSEEAASTPPERTNLRFHLAMLATAKLFGVKVHAPAQLATLAKDDTPITDADFPACLAQLRGAFSEFEAKTGDTMDKIAKGPAFVDFVLDKAFPAG